MNKKGLFFTLVLLVVAFIAYQLYFFALNVRDTPTTLWNGRLNPKLTLNHSDYAQVGVQFRPRSDGYITGMRFYKDPQMKSSHSGYLWSGGGQLLATATFTDETPSGWQEAAFPRPVQVLKDLVYMATTDVIENQHAETRDYFPVYSIQGSLLHAENGVFSHKLDELPKESSNSNFWVDVTYYSSIAVKNNGLPDLPPTGPGGPILIITSAENPSSAYYEEILKAEGLNLFKTEEIKRVTSTLLNHYDVVILAEMPLDDSQAKMLSDWVMNGGNLIAMRPDKKLASLFGLTPTKSILSEGYLLIDKEKVPGLVEETIQYHGDADKYDSNDATTIALLYKNATDPTSHPAVTLRKVGSGNAAAFTYDLAKSIIATRQGNINWAHQKRDLFFLRRKNGLSAIIPTDLFYPHFVNLDKVEIPQADEQQRLLANIILQINQNKKPLPRFWYLPNGKKAVFLHALDDHANVGTATKQTFNRLKERSPKGSSALDWGPFRATSWFYVGIPLTDSEAKSYFDEGFEMGDHVSTLCKNWTPSTIKKFFYKDLREFQNVYPSLPPQKTNRTHCVVWSDWSTEPIVELYNQIRLDSNYYYYPANWVKNHPGLFTGSGFPMPYTDINSVTIPVYQATTQLTNESGLSYPEASLALINQALGPKGYYGIFTTHDDFTHKLDFLDPLIEVAIQNGISIVSAQQILTWLEGRNSSSFEIRNWHDNFLNLKINIGKGASYLQAMLPIKNLDLVLDSITRKKEVVSYTKETIKGITYAIFLVEDGDYEVNYIPAL